MVTATSGILRDRRIFIFEDDVTNRSVMQLLLEQQGATVTFERWGIDIENRLQKFAPIDIILMDLMFPNNISGYDIAEQIRNNNDFAHIPIVAVSASEADKEIPNAHQRGFAGFIAKPINMVLFAKQIALVLDGQSVWYTGK